jgi:Electron transfer DM13
MRFIILIILVVSVIITSCKKENYASTATLNEMTDTASVLKFTGNFASGPYGTVAGKAEIYKKGIAYEVKLAGFTTTNGPALHVYLSKEAVPLNFLDLGALKSTNGNQVYSISGMPDFMEYKYISIHCVAYNHLFGWALIQ